jgi:hypothetical protein
LIKQIKIIYQLKVLNNIINHFFSWRARLSRRRFDVLRPDETQGEAGHQEDDTDEQKTKVNH